MSARALEVHPSQGAGGERYAARVWREFKGNTAALVSLWIIGAMGALALAADLIASDKPYYIEIDGRTHFPVLLDYGVRLGHFPSVH